MEAPDSRGPGTPRRSRQLRRRAEDAPDGAILAVQLHGPLAAVLPEHHGGARPLLPTSGAAEAHGLPAVPWSTRSTRGTRGTTRSTSRSTRNHASGLRATAGAQRPERTVFTHPRVLWTTATSFHDVASHEHVFVVTADVLVLGDQGVLLGTYFKLDSRTAPFVENTNERKRVLFFFPLHSHLWPFHLRQLWMMMVVCVHRP